jgi:hypothetical protein
MRFLNMAHPLATLLAASALSLATGALAAGAASAQTIGELVKPAAAAPPSVTPATGAAGDSRTAFLSEPITVEAKRLAAKQRALNLIHGYSGKKHYWEAVAGWYGDVCVSVAGLDPAQDAAVKARIEAIAGEAGVTVKQKRCGPEHVPANVEVFFTADPDRLLKSIAHDRPWIVGGTPTRVNPLISVRAYETGLTMKRPIEAWYVNNCEPDVAPGPPPGQLLQAIITGYWNLPSYYGPCQKIGFDNVLVVVDKRRIPGLSLGVLADYAAMLALTQPASLDGCNALPSIIDLFSAACADQPEPTGLTESDTAYLKALYTGGQTLPPGWQAPGDIAGRMVNLLVPASATR